MKSIFTAVMSNNLVQIESEINGGIDINIKDRDGRTPLINSVIDNNLVITRYLLSNGANVNIQDRNGYASLHFSCQNQNYEITKLLIESGADIESVDAYGNTPLSKAVFYYRGVGDVVQYLLLSGADKNRKNNHGISPKGLALSIANYDVGKYFDE
jgi:uncharacterized protein